VQVVPGIDLDFEFSKRYDCENRPRLNVINKTEEKEGESYWFDFGDGSHSELMNDVHTFAEDRIYTVKLFGRKEFCVYELSKEIPIYTIRVPNVITPADQTDLGSKNDTFRFQYGELATPSIQLEARLTVFNRWGELVYENTRYKGEWGGEGLSEGVYYYELEISGETTCKSWIHVIK
jgi:PKD repeat protein